MLVAAYKRYRKKEIELPFEIPDPEIIALNVEQIDNHKDKIHQNPTIRPNHDSDINDSIFASKLATHAEQRPPAMNRLFVRHIRQGVFSSTQKFIKVANSPTG